MNSSTHVLMTSRGPMTVAEVFDRVTYNSFAANRDYGMTVEKLRVLFKGDTDRYEQMYREEQDKRKADFEKVKGYLK